MSRRHVTPLRRIDPPIEPWSVLIDGSMYTVWQQATDTSENAEPTPTELLPQFDGYFGQPDNDDSETEDQR